MRRTPRQNAVLLLFPLFLALAVVFQALHPTYAVTQFTGAVIPLAAIGFFLTEGAFTARRRSQLRREEEKELDALRRKFRAQVARREPRLLVLPPDFLDIRKRDLEAEKRSRLDQVMAELNAGMLTRDEASARWEEARRLLDSLGGGSRMSPADQVKELGAQYGLPVAAPLRKPEPLPLVTAPPVSAAREQEEEEYVPAGQAELSADLLVILRQEVRARGGDLAGQQSHFPSLRWFMSPEWLDEVRKLRTSGASGRLVFTPRERASKSRFEGRLYGYPVTAGDAFGVPELREP